MTSVCCKEAKVCPAGPYKVQVEKILAVLNFLSVIVTLSLCASLTHAHISHRRRTFTEMLLNEHKSERMYYPSLKRFRDRVMTGNRHKVDTEMLLW